MLINLDEIIVNTDDIRLVRAYGDDVNITCRELYPIKIKYIIFFRASDEVSGALISEETFKKLQDHIDGKI